MRRPDAGRAAPRSVEHWCMKFEGHGGESGVRTVGQKPVKAAKTLGMFRPPESLNSARIERMTPSMDCFSNEDFIDGVIRSIRALFTDSGGRNMPRVLAACNGFWPTLDPESSRVVQYCSNGTSEPTSWLVSATSAAGLLVHCADRELELKQSAVSARWPRSGRG